VLLKGREFQVSFLTNYKGEAIVEYALVTLAVVILLYLILDVAEPNFFSAYLGKAAKSILISVSSISDLASQTSSIANF
jgi:hypothetical protein